jgi:hypothetical protein
VPLAPWLTKARLLYRDGHGHYLNSSCKSESILRLLMDLALEGVHVLVTGTTLFFRPSKSIKCNTYLPGASGGIGLETVRLFLGLSVYLNEASIRKSH